MSEELKNKPLVEAIMEIRWKLEPIPSDLQKTQPAFQTDRHYKLLLGRLYDRIRENYPIHEQLTAANVPDEFVSYLVQHRFRVAENSWPLIQIGPGVFTINSTNDYKWEPFRDRVLDAINKFYDAHPRVDDLKLTNLILRYIDAVGFDYKSINAFDFLKDQLKVGISLPVTLFAKTGVENKPNSFTCQCSFKSDCPKGHITVRFATGQRNNAPAIIWETVVESTGENVPEMTSGFHTWLENAHAIAHNWFFQMIEGELHRRFRGE
jgi:uncharacterized protein (TIGR04255 family)